MELTLFVLALCLFVGIALYAMARPDVPPQPDEPDTEPPSDFLPDITTRSAKTLRDSIK